MEHKRTDRVAELILEELAEVLLRKVKDPRIGNITLTDVEVSGDLRNARVFYSLMGDEQRKAGARAGLESARGFVKRELSRRLKLRVMPDIAFHFDPSLERGSRIERLLSDVRESEGQ
jgi:ribosome-binding factor A